MCLQNAWYVARVNVTAAGLQTVLMLSKRVRSLCLAHHMQVLGPGHQTHCYAVHSSMHLQMYQHCEGHGWCDDSLQLPSKVMLCAVCATNTVCYISIQH